MMHFGEKFTDEEVEEMIAEADTNNDGKIEYEEFSKMLLQEIAWTINVPNYVTKLWNRYTLIEKGYKKLSRNVNHLNYFEYQKAQIQ